MRGPALLEPGQLHEVEHLGGAPRDPGALEAAVAQAERDILRHRHVATLGSTWLALIGCQPGAFKLAARDRWIGWSAQQQFRRLHLIANNARFVILTPHRVANLASRVLGLSLRRLSGDMQAVHGYPVVLAETFVDPARFAGTCYRASNWRSLGLTRGYAREPGGSARWRHHGQPKELFVFELTAHGTEALSQAETPAQCGNSA